MTYGLALALLATLGLACSGSSPGADSGKVADGSTADGASLAPDGVRRLDTKVPDGPGASGGEAGGVRDARDSGIDGQVRDVAADRTEVRDIAPTESGGTRDTNRDSNRDGVADAAPEPDAPSTTLPVRGTCASPIDIPYGVLHGDISVNTANAEHVVDFPCVDNGRDVVFRIQSQQSEMFYADTFGATWNTALFFSDSCENAQPLTGANDSEMATCSDDSCESFQSLAVASLGYGYHYLILSGVNDEAGEATLHFQRAPIGNGPVTTLPPGTGTLAGVTRGTDWTGTCESAGPKNSYWWATCPDAAGGVLHASTCQGADWDTLLILEVPHTDTVLCSDDDASCGMQSVVDATIPPGAGLYIVTVAGMLPSSAGAYTLAYTRP